MAVSEAQKRANAKWTAENMKKFTVKIRIEEYEAFDSYCKDNGIPKNTLMRKLINDAVKNGIRP